MNKRVLFVISYTCFQYIQVKVILNNLSPLPSKKRKEKKSTQVSDLMRTTPLDVDYSSYASSKQFTYNKEKDAYNIFNDPEDGEFFA